MQVLQSRQLTEQKQQKAAVCFDVLWISHLGREVLLTEKIQLRLFKEFHSNYCESINLKGTAITVY